jgi:hypothetical protein
MFYNSTNSTNLLAYRCRTEVLTAVVMKTSVFWDITPGKSTGSQPTFSRNISPPSSTLKNKPSTGFLPGLLSDQKMEAFL